MEPALKIIIEYNRLNQKRGHSDGSREFFVDPRESSAGGQVVGGKYYSLATFIEKNRH